MKNGITFLYARIRTFICIDLDSFFCIWGRTCVSACIRASLCVIFCSSLYTQPISVEEPQIYVDLTEVEKYVRDAEVRALLDTVAHAEGTFIPSQEGDRLFGIGAPEDSYRILFGKGRFESMFGDHPRCVICLPYAGTQLCSSAAGRYQFLQKTWDRVSESARIKDFSPANQDRAAVYLLLEAQAIEPLKQGDFTQAISCIKTIWASMPGAPYGQPTVKLQKLHDFYQERCAYHRRALARKKREAQNSKPMRVRTWSKTKKA